MYLIGVVVIIEVEALVKEITAVIVEALTISQCNRGWGHQFNFCKIKCHKGSSDGIEIIYQSKVDSSLNSDVNDME